MVTSLPTKRISAISQRKQLSEFYRQDGGESQQPAGIKIASLPPYVILFGDISRVSSTYAVTRIRF